MDDRLANDPLSVAEQTPTVDLAGLAFLFTAPARLGEFMPSSFVSGVTLHWPAIQSEIANPLLSEAFVLAVADLCTDTEVVGIALSGGVDSLAVLIHVLGLRPPRRVIAYVVDLVDDTGTSTAAIVRQLLSNLGLIDSVELTTIRPFQCTTHPTWSSCGLRLDALPVVNGGLQGLYRYLTDMACGGPGVLGEIVAVGCQAMSATTRTHMYRAANWPELCAPTVSPVVASHYRNPAQRWAKDYVDSMIAGHTATGRSLRRGGRARCMVAAQLSSPCRTGD